MPAARSQQPAKLPPAERIMNAAMSLFARHGFNGTTTRMIAEKARMNEAIIFRHFRDKKALYAAILKSRMQQDVVLQGAASSDSQIDLEVLLRTLAERLITGIRHDPEFMRLLYFSGLEGHKLAAEFFEGYSVHINGFLASRIKEAVRAGEFRKVDPQLASRIFFGMVAHHVIMEVLFGLERSPWKDKELIDGFVGVFLEGLRKQEPKAVKKKHA